MTVRAPVAGVVRTPTILQMEALESGAAALAMVLAHYGKWVPLEELRVLCGVSRDGSKAINLLKAARQLGLKAGGKRLEPADLATLPVPAILLVNMNHFVVFEGVTARGFQINDPAGGRRTLAPAECDRMFTGVALAFVPGCREQDGDAEVETVQHHIEHHGGADQPGPDHGEIPFHGLSPQIAGWILSSPGLPSPNKWEAGPWAAFNVRFEGCSGGSSGLISSGPLAIRRLIRRMPAVNTTQ